MNDKRRGNIWDAPDPEPVASGEKPKRHRWVKVRIHFYVCRDCGMQKENAETEGWQTKYHRPDGVSRVEFTVPPCVEGPKTAEYLATYAEEIAVHEDPTIPHRYRASSHRNLNCALCDLYEDDSAASHV